MNSDIIKLLFFSDVFSLLIGIMMFSGFPNTNFLIIDIINIMILWGLVKTISYFILIHSYKYFKYIALPIIILSSFYTIYILSSIIIFVPTSSIPPEFYQEVYITNNISVLQLK